MTELNAAAKLTAQTGADALAWYKQQQADNKPMQDKLNQMSLDVSTQQLASSKANDALSAEYADYQRTTFRPLEQKVVAEAQNYNTPEKQQAAADAASADVNIAFDKQGEANARTLAANGINPGSARAMSVMQGQGVDQAVASAGASNKARKGVEAVGHAMQMDAASLGRGLASSQATAAQTAIQAGNSAVSNSGAAVTAGNQTTATTGAGYNAALSGMGSAGSMYGNIVSGTNSANANSINYGAAQGKQDDALWGAVGQIGGAMIVSDENVKTDITQASDAEALAAVNKTPVKKWKYDPAKMAAQGLDVPADAQGENVGPMAQDVQENMGDGAAPDGKKLNMVTMNGVNMKAIQALDKKVNNLAKLIKGGTIKAGAKT